MKFPNLIASKGKGSFLYRHSTMMDGGFWRFVSHISLLQVTLVIVLSVALALMFWPIWRMYVELQDEMQWRRSQQSMFLVEMSLGAVDYLAALPPHPLDHVAVWTFPIERLPQQVQKRIPTSGFRVPVGGLSDAMPFGSELVLMIMPHEYEKPVVVDGGAHGGNSAVDNAANTAGDSAGTEANVHQRKAGHTYAPLALVIERYGDADLPQRMLREALYGKANIADHIVAQKILVLEEVRSRLARNKKVMPVLLFRSSQGYMLETLSGKRISLDKVVPVSLPDFLYPGEGMVSFGVLVASSTDALTALMEEGKEGKMVEIPDVSTMPKGEGKEDKHHHDDRTTDGE